MPLRGKVELDVIKVLESDTKPIFFSAKSLWINSNKVGKMISKLAVICFFFIIIQKFPKVWVQKAFPTQTFGAG